MGPQSQCSLFQAARSQGNIRRDDNIPRADFIDDPVVRGIGSCVHHHHLDSGFPGHIDSLVGHNNHGEPQTGCHSVDLVLDRARIGVDENLDHWTP